jgi:hypothetical protein
MISLNTKEITTYDVWNPGIGLGQAQNHDGVKPVYVIYALQNQATYYFLISVLYRLLSIKKRLKVLKN